MKTKDTAGLYYRGELMAKGYTEAVKELYGLKQIPSGFCIDEDYMADGYSVIDNKGVQHIYELSPRSFYGALMNMEDVDTVPDEYWKLLIYQMDEIRKQNGQTMQDVADLTGYLQSGVARFFSAKFKPALPMFLDYAKAVGVNFFFESKNSNTDLNHAFEQAMEKLGRRPDKLPKN